jgi:signal transduction histidine kinase
MMRGALTHWLEELCLGRFDQDYFERRRRTVLQWVQLALPETYIFLAVGHMRALLAKGPPRGIARESWESAIPVVHRALDLELSLFASSYLKTHESAQLRSLQGLMIRSLPIAVLCLDAEGRVTAATRGSPAIREHAELGVHYESFLRPEIVEAADLPTHIGRTLAQQEEVVIPRVLLDEGPDALHFRIRIVPFNHEFTPVVLHVEDITDVVLAEARAQQAEALARIGSLAANVAHEIRNPLTAISTTVQVISSSLETADRRRGILLKLQEQVIRLDRLVSDLLSYARPAKTVLQTMDLQAAAQEAVTFAGLRVAIETRGVSRALGDPMAVHHILLNLLQNAREAAGAEGRVLIQIGPGPTLSVADDGPGIAPEVRERLFDPFVTTRARGTGLGLAISRKLCEAMGGRLALEESPSVFGELPQGRGPGAEFRLTLASPHPTGPVSPGDT